MDFLLQLKKEMDSTPIDDWLNHGVEPEDFLWGLAELCLFVGGSYLGWLVLARLCKSKKRAGAEASGAQDSAPDMKIRLRPRRPPV